MSDVLRAARLRPGFLEAADVWLVETSEPLRGAAARAPGRALTALGRPTWPRSRAARR